MEAQSRALRIRRRSPGLRWPPLPYSVLSHPRGLCSRSTFFRKSSLSICPELIFAPREERLRLQLGGRAPSPGHLRREPGLPLGACASHGASFPFLPALEFQPRHAWRGSRSIPANPGRRPSPAANAHPVWAADNLGSPGGFPTDSPHLGERGGCRFSVNTCGVSL